MNSRDIKVFKQPRKRCSPYQRQVMQSAAVPIMNR